MMVGVPGGERTMKEQNRLTRHSNLWLIWHDTESMHLSFHWVLLSYARSLCLFPLHPSQSVNNSELATSGSGRSRVWEQTRRTWENIQFRSSKCFSNIFVWKVFSVIEKVDKRWAIRPCAPHEQPKHSAMHARYHVTLSYPKYPRPKLVSHQWCGVEALYVRDNV